MSLEKIREELRKFKSSLLELSMEKNIQEDELVRLVNSSADKESLLEVLILIYSNSKSDAQSVKSYQIKTLVEIVDKLEASIVSYNELFLLMDAKINNNFKDIYTRLDVIDDTIDYKLKTRFINTWYGKVIFGIGTALFVVFMFFYLYRLDPDGAKFTSDIFNNMFDKTINTSKDSGTQPGGK